MNATSSTPEHNEVVLNDSCTVLVGPDAINMYRAMHLKVALNLYARTGMLMTRGATPTLLLRMATEYTGKTYKGKDKYITAAADVKTWVETMKAALPITDNRS